MRRTAFTLIELLVVLAIIGLLTALAFPALRPAAERGRSTKCKNNLRQMAMTASMYTDTHGGFFPPAFRGGKIDGKVWAWDFAVKGKGESAEIFPGILWDGVDMDCAEIQQCPSFHGASMTAHDPYTGYNYNTSYIGDPDNPAHVDQIQEPARTALFGDGQYGSGANKYMRSPYPSPKDGYFFGRWAGTQGFRHNGKSNVAFCDGHVESMQNRYVENADGKDRVAPGTGFLSADNSLYDLE